MPLSPASVSGWPPGCLTPTRQWCCQQWRSWWNSWSSFPRTLTITTCCWRNLPLLWWPCCLESLKFSMLPWGTSTWLCRKGKGSGGVIPALSKAIWLSQTSRYCHMHRISFNPASDPLRDRLKSLMTLVAWIDFLYSILVLPVSYSISLPASLHLLFRSGQNCPL